MTSHRRGGYNKKLKFEEERKINRWIGKRLGKNKINSPSVTYGGSLIGCGTHPAEHGAVAERGGGLLVVCLGPPADICALGHREGCGHGRAVQVSWKLGHFVVNGLSLQSLGTFCIKTYFRCSTPLFLMVWDQSPSLEAQSFPISSLRFLHHKSDKPDMQDLYI